MYKTINGWTKADMKAAIRLHNKGVMSGDTTDGCLYLSSDGNRCFVGAFLPDNHPGLEQTGNVYELLRVFPDLKNKLPLEVGHLLRLQNVHDESDDIKGAKADLRDLADAWIDVNVVEGT